MNHDDYRQQFEDHRSGLEFEHDLINRKLTWLLTSQTILFAALGLTLQAPSVTLVRIVGGVGLAICSFISIGLVGNVIAKVLVHNDYSKVEPHTGSEQAVRWGLRGTGKVEFGVRTWTTWLGLLADFGIPLTFLAAWICVLVLANDIVDAAI